MADRITTGLNSEQQVDFNRAMAREAANPQAKRVVEDLNAAAGFGIEDGIRPEWQAEIDANLEPAITPIQRASLIAKDKDNKIMKIVEEEQAQTSNSFVRQLNKISNKRWWQFWK